MGEEEKLELEEYAYYLLSPGEICIIMGYNDEIKNQFTTPGNDYFIAYQKGKLKQLAKFRASVIKMANEGSSAAQTMVNEWLQNILANELSGK